MNTDNKNTKTEQCNIDGLVVRYCFECHDEPTYKDHHYCYDCYHQEWDEEDYIERMEEQRMVDDDY